MHDGADITSSTAAPALRRFGAGLPPDVMGQLVGQLFRSPWPMLTSVMTSTAIAAIGYGAVPTGQIAAWLASVWLLCLLRYGFFRYFHRVNPTGEGAARWADGFALGIMALGALFGATGLIMYETPDVLAQMAVVVVACGLAAGVASTYASYLFGVIAYLAISLLPIAIVCVSLGDRTHLVLAGLIVLFATNLALIARSVNRTMIGILVLGHEKDLLTRTLAEEQQRTERASRAKSDFLATMSHELRTPLNAIIGFSELMQSETFGSHASPKYHEYSRDIHGSAHHLLSLINDILDSAKLEAGKYVLNEAPVDLCVIAAEAARVMREQARRKQIELVLSLDDTLIVRADERALRQILLNLLSNAIKFTPENGRVDLVATLPAGGAPRVVVSDNGIGIPEADLPAVLNSYGRASNAYLTDRSGTGLGLPITRSLVALHDGSFDIESQQGVGTVVTICLPAARLAV